MTDEIKTLYSNQEKTNALFPRTKKNAVSDDEGHTLGDVGFLDYVRTGDKLQLKDKEGTLVYPVSSGGGTFDYEVDEIVGMEVDEEVSFDFNEEITSLTSSDATKVTASYIGRTITIVAKAVGSCTITINGTKVIPVSVIS